MRKADKKKIVKTVWHPVASGALYLLITRNRHLILVNANIGLERVCDPIFDFLRNKPLSFR